ncbi:MAG TPA: hypothetical protein VD926_10845, partial [Acidimicrobiales bacterium]|nr:hypothetical protein [Acidimicrobiales bacterium]
LLPMTEQEARDCFTAIQAAEFRPSGAGTTLAANLLAELHRLMPGRRADRHVDAFVRLYVTDEWAEVLGLGPARPHRLFRPMRWLWQHPGSWGHRVRRPVRRRLSGLHRNLHDLLTTRLVTPEVRSYRTADGDRALGDQLRQPAAAEWRGIPQCEPVSRRRRSHR